MNLRRPQIAFFAGILLLFVVCAALLINRDSVYTPDSAEYVILAEALFSGQEIAALLKKVEGRLGHPENFLRLLEIAGLYYLQKEYGLALEYIDRSLALNPDFPDTHFFQGVSCEARGMTEKATAAYRRALELAPGHSPARQRLDELQARSNFRGSD